MCVCVNVLMMTQTLTFLRYHYLNNMLTKFVYTIVEKNSGKLTIYFPPLYYLYLKLRSSFGCKHLLQLTVRTLDNLITN